MYLFKLFFYAKYFTEFVEKSSLYDCSFLQYKLIFKNLLTMNDCLDLIIKV